MLISFVGQKKTSFSITGLKGKKVVFSFNDREISLGSSDCIKITDKGSLEIEFFKVGLCEYIIVKLNGELCFIDGYRYLSGHLHYVGLDEVFYIKVDNTPIHIRVVKKWQPKK